VARGPQCVNRGPRCSAFRVKSARTCFNLVLMDWPRALESFRFVSQNVAPDISGFDACGKRSPCSLAVRRARDVVLTRCERGADIARMLFLGSDLAGHQG